MTSELIMKVWNNERLQIYLSHYYQLLRHQTTAFYLRCKSIPVDFNTLAPIDRLWSLHDQTQQQFSSFQNSQFCEPKQTSYLDLKLTIACRMLEYCKFCENQCHVNRINGHRGKCGISDESFVSSAFLHFGEEAPLVPSGTIFFAGCSFDCIFCQNSDISSAGKTIPVENAGDHVTPKQLARIANYLATGGALNINYVGGDPTPNIHTILASLKFQNDNICQLWNSNFYNTDLILRLFADVIDLWLPDFKYGNNQCAQELSGIQQYWNIITRNFKYIYTHGSKSIIIRHLVMPNHIECCSKPILNWIATHVPHCVINIMNQFHPTRRVASGRKDLNRKVTPAEMNELYSLADRLDLEYKSVS